MQFEIFLNDYIYGFPLTAACYKYYLIYISKKGKYKLYGDDLMMSHYFNIREQHLNKIKLDNLEVIEQVIYDDNKYLELYVKMIIIDAINCKINSHNQM